MNFLSLLLIELQKLRRSKLLPLLLAAAIFLWLPAMFHLDLNFSRPGPGISPAENFFIQGFLGAAWFMLPACQVLCTVLVIQTERAGRGMLKMLALPVDTVQLCLAKFAALLLLSTLGLLLQVGAYFAFGTAAGALRQYGLLLPPAYVLRQAGKLLVFSLPMLTFFWMAAVCIQTPILSVGVGFASIVPSVLVMNTKIWFLYPMCYPFYALTAEYGRLSDGLSTWELPLFPLLPVALLFSAACLTVSCLCFGQSERRS